MYYNDNGGDNMEIKDTLTAFLPFIIICLVALVLVIVLIRGAVKNKEHRVRNIILAIVVTLIPILIYAGLYIFGRILTG